MNSPDQRPEILDDAELDAVSGGEIITRTACDGSLVHVDSRTRKRVTACYARRVHSNLSAEHGVIGTGATPADPPISGNAVPSKLQFDI